MTGAVWNTLTTRMVLVIATALFVSQLTAILVIQANLNHIIKWSSRHSQITYAAEALRRVNRAAPGEDTLSLVQESAAVISVWTSPTALHIDGARRDPALETRLRRLAGSPPDQAVSVMMAGLDAVSRRRPREPRLERASDNGYGLLYCAVQRPNGEWLTFVVRPQPRFWPPSPPIAMFLSTSLIIVTVAAAAVARRVARPFRAFAEAADRLTAGERHEPVDVFGPVDVRRAQTAFNVMGARLQATLASQNALLAAIGHDVRTPLTSLRVRVELLPDDRGRERMSRALDELQRLTDAALQAASDHAFSEPIQAFDVVALVAAVCEDVADLGAPVAFREPHTRPILRGWPDELGRAVRNIIENAVRYGGRAEVALEATRASCVILVRDDGPGIPEADLARVFDPLVRLEPSRSAQTGGHGLGLHIAQNTVAAHGGTITLRNRRPSGLEARISLPAPAEADRDGVSAPLGV